MATGRITSVADKTGNGHDLTPTTGPWDYDIDYFQFRAPDNSVCSVLRVEDSGLWLPTGHGALFQNDHEFHFVVSGRMFSVTYLFGVAVGTQVYHCSIENSGKISFTFRFGGSNTVIRSINPVFAGTGSDARRAYAKTYIRHQIDFTNDTFRVWVNGGEIPMEVVSGLAISSWSPTYYTGTNAFGIGTYNNNNNGASQGWADHYRIVFRAAVTEKITDTNKAYLIAKVLLAA